MGPYCNYCGRRCFVEREVPGSHVTILATCTVGALHDMAGLGVDHTTARNPYARNSQATEFPTCTTCGERNVEDAGDHADSTGHWPTSNQQVMGGER